MVRGKCERAASRKWYPWNFLLRNEFVEFPRVTLRSRNKIWSIRCTLVFSVHTLESGGAMKRSIMRSPRLGARTIAVSLLPLLNSAYVVAERGRTEWKYAATRQTRSRKVVGHLRAYRWIGGYARIIELPLSDCHYRCFPRSSPSQLYTRLRGFTAPGSLRRWGKRWLKINRREM